MKRISVVTIDNIKATVIAAVLFGVLAHTVSLAVDIHTAYNSTHHIAQDKQYGAHHD